MTYIHDKRCETCKYLEKDFGDWGFDPYCRGWGNHVQGFKISLEIWEWIKRYGCASYDLKQDQDLYQTYKQGGNHDNDL